MKKNKVSLFLNTKVGFNLAQYLLNDKRVYIEQVFLCGHYKKIDNKIKKLFTNKKTNIYENVDKVSTSRIIESNKNSSFFICVYWPFLLSKSDLDKSFETINFHPAYLPINRGWYPHVHSIIDGSKIGVTLHRITIGPDQGDIWVQKEINYAIETSVLDLYKTLQDEIFKLFVSNWSKILNKKINPTPQDIRTGNYHKKNEIDELDFIDLENKETLKLINILRARSFGDKGYAYIINNNGEKVFLNLRLSKKQIFN